MNTKLLCALMLSAALAAPAFAAEPPYSTGQVVVPIACSADNTKRVTDGCPLATKNSTASYTETTVAVTGGTWRLLAAASATRKKLIVGDRAGLTCSWSLIASPVSNEGFPFSSSGVGGSWVFDDPISVDNIYVVCSSSGTLTLAGS